MATTSLQNELDCAHGIARHAGRLIMKHRGAGFDVEMKAGDEPVTVADREANALIVGKLAEAFPSDPVISEELEPPPGALGAARVWFVDPIDGTKDFIRGADGFAVMIGLAIDGKPVLGVVYQPSLDRMFSATREAGAWMTLGASLENRRAAAPTREELHVSSIANAAEVRLVASASHRSPDIDRVKNTLGIDNELNVGSVGVKLCLIAMGARDLYVNPAAKTKVWDTCGPEAILTLAGGRLSDLQGAPVDYGELRQRRGLVASNGHVHDEVIAKLAPLFAKRT